MYCLLSQIINAAIYAAVPSHNRWPISTQLLFMRLSQPSAIPQAPQQERWRNYFIARGARKLSFVRNSSSGSFVNWQLLPILLWHHMHWKVWAQKQERLNCSVISLLCSRNLWCVIWERPPEGGRKRLASNKTLSAVCRGTSLFIFFFFILFRFL